VRELTSPQVKISAETNEMAEITTGTSVFKINGMNKAEFPTLPDLSGSPEISLPSSKLKEMLSKTVFSAGREDSRYMLNGVQFSVASQKATFIGTDGKRLAKAQTPVNLEASIVGSYVIPLKAVEEMIKLLDEGEGQAHLSISHDKISLE